MKGKELVLTVRQDLDDLFHLLLEPDFQDPVRLVDDERFQILENEGFGVLHERGIDDISQRVQLNFDCRSEEKQQGRDTHPQVIQQPPRSSHDQVDPLGQPIRLGLPIRTTHNHPESLTVEPTHQVPHDGEDLKGQFPGWREDDDSRPVGRFEFESTEDFDGRDQEGQGLAGSGSGCTKDVTTGEERRDGPGLYFCHRGESEGVDSGLSLGREVEGGESLGGQGRSGGGSRCVRCGRGCRRTSFSRDRSRGWGRVHSLSPRRPGSRLFLLLDSILVVIFLLLGSNSLTLLALSLALDLFHRTRLCGRGRGRGDGSASAVL